MTPAEFDAALRRDGYEPRETTIAAGEERPLHTHPWDTSLLVLEGTFTLTTEDSARTYTLGESFDVAAGMIHGERIGPEGARLLVGRRTPAG